MNRRGYLGSVVTLGSIGLAGCGILGGSDDGPDAAAANFLRALDDGDTEEADSYLHEAHGSVTDVMSERTLNRFESLDMTVEETAVVEESDEEATVELTYSADGTSETETERFELVTNDDDEWVIFSSSDG